MKTTPYFGTLVALLAILGFPQFICADEPKHVPIASYVNRPEVVETDGRRAATILRDHKIENVSVGSAGMTMSVPAAQASEARRLLAAAIKAEGLRITLIELTPTGDRAVIVTPESILPAAAAKPVQPIALLPGPHLFIDGHLIAHHEHLERVLNHPTRRPAPIITAREDKNFQPYISVVHDPQTRRFRIWYDAPADPPKIEPSRLAYLESEDGIAWLRPHRFLENPGGLEIRFGASVFDEGPAFPDPARRFKLGWCWGKFTDASPGGLMVATSPDGFTWTPVAAKPPVLAHDHDINNIFFDPIRKRYLATVSKMVPAPDGKGKRRQPFQSISDDLVHWSEPWPVIAPDEKDEGEFQYYAMSGYLARGDLLIGLAKILRDDLPAEPGGPTAGIGYTVLTWTRDGRTWQRERAPFLDRNPAPGTWDHAMTWIDCQLLAADELLLYYGGYARGHKVERFTERQIGLARMPRDRYVAHRAGAEQGTLRTPTVLIDATALTVNASIEGELLVRVLDPEGQPIPGLDWTDCTPIRGDAVAHPVRWREPLTAVRGRPVQLEFALTKAQLYSFDLAASAPRNE